MGDDTFKRADWPMHLHLHHHHDSLEPRLQRIETLLAIIQRQGEKLMGMSRAEAKRLDQVSNAILTRMQHLLELVGDQLSEEEKAEIEADFAMLEELGKDPNVPVPPVDPGQPQA